MNDHDLSHQLHALADSVDQPFDMAALRRRITTQNRRHAVAKVGVAGVGLAAVVAGLTVVRDGRDRPSKGSVNAATTPVPSTVDAAVAVLPDCRTALDDLRTSQSTVDSATLSSLQAAKQAAANVPPEFAFDFKGLVSILSVDGQQITFRVEAPESTPDGAATLDANTRWTDGSGAMDAASTLHVGDRVGLATDLGADGVEHVVAVDLGASAVVDQAPTSASDPKQPVTGPIDQSVTPDSRPDFPGDTATPGPTAKAAGTLTAIDATSITISVDALPGEPGPVDVLVHPASVRFLAGESPCDPTSLAVGAKAGIGYHVADGTIVVDDVALIP